MRHGLLRFMRAHGQAAGPGQRPRLAGALAGLLAGLLALPILEWSGAVTSLVDALRLSTWLTPLLYLGIAILAGVVYGAVFQRAACDRRGGWLFGLSYGFLLWMLGPIALLQAILDRPLVTGIAAMGVLGANLLSGLVLGVLFHPMHGLVRKQLGERGRRGREQPSPERRRVITFPHTIRHPR